MALLPRCVRGATSALASTSQCGTRQCGSRLFPREQVLNSRWGNGANNANQSNPVDDRGDGAVIVGVDLAFFRDRFWERLMVNIGIALVFAAFYLRLLMRP